MGFSSSLAVVAMAGLLSGATLARAQEAPPAAGPPVRVETMIVYVSSQPGSIDPRANALARTLRQEFNLQTMRVIQMQQLSLALRQIGQVELPTGHWVTVRPEEFTSKGLRMGVEVQGMLRTNVNVPSGNDVVIGAYSYENGRLVVRLAPVYETPPGLLPTAPPAPGAQPGGPMPASSEAPR